MQPQIDRDIIDKIKANYKEVDKVYDEVIAIQQSYAEILVKNDILEGNLKKEFEEIGIVYMTCHLLYMNYFKNSETRINGDTSSKKLTPGLGAGIKASPYGQLYLTLYSIASSDDEDSAVSGVIFL